MISLCKMKCGYPGGLFQSYTFSTVSDTKSAIQHRKRVALFNLCRQTLKILAIYMAWLTVLLRNIYFSVKRVQFRSVNAFGYHRFFASYINSFHRLSYKYNIMCLRHVIWLSLSSEMYATPSGTWRSYSSFCESKTFSLEIDIISKQN